jgi:hypothetical protein
MIIQESAKFRFFDLPGSKDVLLGRDEICIDFLMYTYGVKELVPLTSIQFQFAYNMYRRQDGSRTLWEFSDTGA